MTSVWRVSTIANYLRASSRSARAEDRARARSFAGSGVKAESPKLHFPTARRRHAPSKSVHPSKAPSKGVAGLTSKKTLVRMSNRGIGAGALVRQMNASSLGFVGGLLYAIRKAGRSPPEPPEYLKCPVTQELFTDPVILSQTGYTYDRAAIERWLRQKSPPTDPSSNVELWTTETVPNWALRDAVNEWCIANGVRQLDAPEHAKRHVAGGRNGRDSKPPRRGRPGDGSGLFSWLGSALRGELAAQVAHDFARWAMNGPRGMPAPVAAHLFAFGVLAGCCAFMTAAVVSCEWALRVVGATMGELQLDALTTHLAGPVFSLMWWAGVFSVVYLAQGGFTDPIRQDMERRRRHRANSHRHHPRHGPSLIHRF